MLTDSHAQHVDQKSLQRLNVLSVVREFLIRQGTIHSSGWIVLCSVAGESLVPVTVNRVKGKLALSVDKISSRRGQDNSLDGMGSSEAPITLYYSVSLDEGYRQIDTKPTCLIKMRGRTRPRSKETERLLQ